jgi:hypothetical protein
MNLPYSDPSNPALPSPLFSDVTAVRGDHMRANNAAIFANFDFLIDLLNEFFTDSDQLTVDEILEKTADAGVTIDGVVCKDGVVTGDVTGKLLNVEWTSARLVGSGLAISGVDGPALAALNGTDVALIDYSNKSLRTYRFDFCVSGGPYRP